MTDGQRAQWDRALSKHAERYGALASHPARSAAGRFARDGFGTLLELGAGQGRDTIFFARRGFAVHALDFADSGLQAIVHKAAGAGLADRVHVVQHDVRDPLPFADGSFTACFSHMLYCMALSEAELAALTAEIHRVLRPRGWNVYTARTIADPDYGRGTYRGERLYELDGFTVQFFDRDTVERLADGFEITTVDEFEEGPLPRRLYRVELRKQ